MGANFSLVRCGGIVSGATYFRRLNRADVSRDLELRNVNRSAATSLSMGKVSLVADESKTLAFKSRVDLHPTSDAAAELQSKQGAFFIKAFQFEFAK